MKLPKRRKTQSVSVGNVKIGSRHPVVIQSMTNTPTEDIGATVTQIRSLIDAGAEMVRITVNDESAAKAGCEIIKILRDQGHTAPIIGDFHFNGHLLLSQVPNLARLLDKYRINPGNVGLGRKHDENFATLIKIAVDNNKPVRIGVNWGSLDQDILKDLLDKNARLLKPKSLEEISNRAIVESALLSAHQAVKVGLKKNKIILSAKTSTVQTTLRVNELLAQKCDFPLHLGLTEAGSGIQGISASVAALAILLEKGIGDTIRISLTPEPTIPRSQEIEVCKSLLQSLGLRFFEPTVTSCPGCGRTKNDYFLQLSSEIKKHIKEQLPQWKERYPEIEKLTIAVMGCIVNGPGESKHAEIGISLPGRSEQNIAPVFVKGKKIAVLQGAHIKEDFMKILNDFLKTKYNQR